MFVLPMLLVYPAMSTNYPAHSWIKPRPPIYRWECGCRQPAVLLATFDLAGHVEIAQEDRYWQVDGRIRVTLDSDNAVYDQAGPRPNLTRRTPGGGTAVLEGKAAWRDRDLLELVLQHFPYRVSRNSKYLNGVDAIHGIW